MYEFLNSEYAVFVGVMGLVFAIPHVMLFVFAQIPGFLMDVFGVGVFGWLVVMAYAAIAFVVVTVGILGGVMSGIIIMFAFMEIIFEALG